MSRTVVSPNLSYIRKLYAPQDALLVEIDAALKKLNIHMQIGADEGKLLQLLIKLHNVKTIVEVGTLAGYSTLWMARALPADGHIHTLERNPKHAAMARDFFSKSDVSNRITLHEGDARASLATLSTKALFDMIFIDADKAAYNDYLDWAEQYVKKGGLIVADNTLLFDTVACDTMLDTIPPNDWNAMRRFNERLADSTKYFATMIPTQDGLSVAIKL